MMTSFWSQRVSDANRDEFVEKLRSAHVDGRIGLDEFERRVESALDAQTYQELVRVMYDLPVAPPAPPPAPAVVVPREPAHPRPFAQALPLAVYGAMAVGGAVWLVYAVIANLAGSPLLLQAVVALATLCVVLPLVLMGGASVVALRHDDDAA